MASRESVDGEDAISMDTQAPVASILVPLTAPRDVQRVWYGTNALSQDHEQALLNWIYDQPFTSLRTRRLQCYGGTPRDIIVSEPLPQALDELCSHVVALGAFPPNVRPNHVLVNEYHPGEGIMAHTDGPLYCPWVAIFSLKSTAMINFYPRTRTDEVRMGNPSPEFQVFLQPRSLLVFADELYEKFMHEIPGTFEDVVGQECACINAELAQVAVGDVCERADVRVSLTIRYVPSPP